MLPKKGDIDLRQTSRTNTSLFQKTVVEQVKIVTSKDSIYVPKDLRIRIVKWYHHYHCHLGKARTHKPLVSLLYWGRWRMKSDNLQNNVQAVKGSRKRIRNTVNYHPRM